MNKRLIQMLLLVAIGLFSIVPMGAQNEKPSISFKTEIPIGGTIKFIISTDAPAKIDWGTGEVTDIPKGEHKITYSDLKGQCISISGMQIKSLNINTQEISFIDVSNCVSLEELQVGYNRLREIDLANNLNLKILGIGANQLHDLDISKNSKLEVLGCFENYLTSLDLSKTESMRWLTCNDNMLSELDLTKMPKLINLYCHNNKIKRLEFSNNPNLEVVMVNNNSLKDLVIKDKSKLLWLFINDNYIEDFQISNCPIVQFLDCFNNKLTSLNIEGMRSLRNVQAYQNRITTFVSGRNDSLFHVNVSCNRLSSEQLKGIYDNLENEEKLVKPPFFAKGFCEADFSFNPGSKSYGDEIIKDTEKGWTITNTPIEGNFNIKLQFDKKEVEKYAHLVIKSYGDYRLEGIEKEGDRYKVISPNTKIIGDIYYLDCSSNNITAIDASEAYNLETLIADDSKISSITLSGSNVLNTLYCGNNEIKELDCTKIPGIVDLSLYANQVSKVDLSKCLQLKSLICRNNQIKDTLDLSMNDMLEELSCNVNKIKNLLIPTKGSLRHVECLRNQIKGDAMNAFLNNLPVYKEYKDDEWDDYMGYNLQGLYLIDPTEKEQNEAFDCQVKIAKDKKWPVYSINYDDFGLEKPQEYNGKESESYQEIDRNEIIIMQDKDKLFLPSAYPLLQIFNMNGCLLKSEINTNSIDIADLSPGVYMLNVYSNYKRNVLKILVK